MKIAKGIRRTKTGFQAYVRVYGKFYSKSYPADALVSDIKNWRERTRAHAKYGAGVVPFTGRTFRDDAKEYLGMIAGMASFRDQARHVNEWIAAFGDRPRATLTVADIRTVLEKWRQTGRNDGKGLAPASLNRRRTVLMAMITALDGRRASNIVKDVPSYDESGNRLIRALPMLSVARIVRHLAVGSKTRARARVMQWTGWPQKLIETLTLHDVDWTHGSVRLPPRRKGKGMAAAVIPVMPRALIALRRFFEVEADGEFSGSALHSSIARAVAKENTWRQAHGQPRLPAFRPYDIRHSFGTWAAGIVKDDRALKELLRTNSIARYTEGATAERLVAARDLLAGPRNSATFNASDGPKRASSKDAHASREKAKPITIAKRRGIS